MTHTLLGKAEHSSAHFRGLTSRSFNRAQVRSPTEFPFRFWLEACYSFPNFADKPLLVDLYDLLQLGPSMISVRPCWRTLGSCYSHSSLLVGYEMEAATFADTRNRHSHQHHSNLAPWSNAIALTLTLGPSLSSLVLVGVGLGVPETKLQQVLRSQKKH